MLQNIMDGYMYATHFAVFFCDDCRQSILDQLKESVIVKCTISCDILMSHKLTKNPEYHLNLMLKNIEKADPRIVKFTNNSRRKLIALLTKSNASKYL
jgi:hypothetical protein